VSEVGQLRLSSVGSFYRWLLPASPVLLALGFGAFEPTVLTLENIINIVQQTAFLFVLTGAQSIVLLTRGFDLSLGPSVSMISVAVAITMTSMVGPHGAGGVVAALVGTAAGLGIGALVGAFNGLAVSWLRVNPFVATLGSMNICLGIGTSISDGRPVFGIPDAFNVAGYSLHVVGVPVPIIYAVVVGAGLHVLLQHTVIGRAFYMLGSNPRAVVVAGWPRRRLLALAYVISAMLTAVGALLLTARVASGEPNLGGGLSLQTISAAVIGGVSLSGGRGSVWSAVIGALFITILANGMNLAAVGGYVQMLVMGAIVILAVALDRVGSLNR
jgi:ribose/xylose/arabinose/galactoside ABC-type transport system permease subunit